MKDIEKLTKLFDEFGIKYTIDTKEDRWGAKFTVNVIVDNDVTDSNVGGYNGFVSSYMFDSDGKFIKVNIWE